MENQVVETPVPETQPESTLPQDNIGLWSDNTPPRSEEQPVIETPVATPAPVVEPSTAVVETPPVVTPKVEEKVVEKIVEKLPEFKDEVSKSIYDAIANGKLDEVYNYLSQQRKDYSTIADIDVVKEAIKLQNPNWSDKDVDIEIKYKFGNIGDKIDLETIDKEIEPERYDAAVNHNSLIEQKELLLQREARDARIVLNDKKQTIELPKFEPQTPQPNQPTQEEVDELNRQWEEKVVSEMGSLTDLSFKVGDDEVNYKLTDEEKNTQTEYMKGFTGEGIAKDRGWINEDGSENVAKIAKDMFILNNIEKVLASARSATKTETTKEVVASIKNVGIEPSQVSSPELGQTLAEKIWS